MKNYKNHILAGSILATWPILALQLGNCKSKEHEVPPYIPPLPTESKEVKAKDKVTQVIKCTPVLIAKPKKVEVVLVQKYSESLLYGIRHFENHALFSGTITEDKLRYDKYGECCEIGYGFTEDLIDMAIRAGKLKAGYKYPKTMTRLEADKFLIEIALPTVEYWVDKYVRQPVSKRQKESLMMFTYNLGPGALRRLVEGESRLNSGNFKSTPKIMKRYVKAGGKTLRGLVKRRNYEANMFMKG
jgi:lysozyme